MGLFRSTNQVGRSKERWPTRRTFPTEPLEFTPILTDIVAIQRPDLSNARLCGNLTLRFN
jgi:hypothetical protein